MPDTSPPTAHIRFDGVRKAYADGTVAVAGLDLDVAAHELLTLVGPSGSGKSTLLRMVNRLVEPTAGRVLLDGTDVATADAVRLRRGIGYVIQDVGLFPHRTVADNVGTVPGLLGWDRGRTRRRVAELLELVGLDPAVYGPRYPHELSGGQRQRVGVARALATDPPVMLMDEPFGAVDPEGRRSLQHEFRRIHDELGTTVLMVTHDIDEAVALGDRVAVLSQGGHLEQLADPVTLLTRPANDVVTGLVGDARAVRLLPITDLTAADLEPVTGPGGGGPPGPADSGESRGPDGGEPGAPDGGSATGPADGRPAAGPAGDTPGRVRLGQSLDAALSALAVASGGVATVVDDADRPVGALTPAGLVRALRRSALARPGPARSTEEAGHAERHRDGPGRG
ncbi:ATP-binding cassette domain-containing protein [Georgenia sp. TF02-10]|uniref:ABC transporter ATP-binding protein n=1 Tax=Georgenia sp. TF02-10 TaxID=2917725 RepID=UPI001FA75CBC|nr:ATP-binding cassette domain-containing protein [Georgenia sp. TF02-10]UNX54752.1 ATP-binding cassette domain-containing protein [Georgenia sp. TF02-10]